MTTGTHLAGQTAQPDASAALERLAAALDPREFITTLTTGPGQPPHLTVTSRRADFGDDIYADNQTYWWSFAERIAPVDNPRAAARKVADVLRTAPEPSRG
jgi:hypothetical protein